MNTVPNIVCWHRHFRYILFLWIFLHRVDAFQLLQRNGDDMALRYGTRSPSPFRTITPTTTTTTIVVVTSKPWQLNTSNKNDEEESNNNNDDERLRGGNQQPQQQQSASSRNEPPTTVTRLFEQSSALTDIQKEQEQVMERLSIAGSNQIAKLSIAERTKRAMLAEAIEDTIFLNADKIETLLNHVSSSNKNSNSDVDKQQQQVVDEIRQEIIDITKETKQLQKQYKELVSGKQSSVLNSLEQIFSSSSSND